MITLVTDVLSDPLVVDTLKSWGAAGAVILVLLAVVIPSLVGVIYLQYRQNCKLNETINTERRAESALIIRLGEATNTALARFSDASEKRNAITSELADTIQEQARAFAMVDQRIGFYHDANVDKIKDLSQVVASVAEALRNNTGIVTEVRNSNLAIAQSTSEAKIKLESVLALSQAGHR